MVVERKNRKALALLYSASEALPNAANSSDVPSKFAAEKATKMMSEKKRIVTCTFRLPPKRQLSIILDFFLIIIIII